MSIITESRIVVQSVVNKSGRLGGKIAIIFREKIELFMSVDGERKLGVNFTIEKAKKPVNIPPIESNKTTDIIVNSSKEVFTHLSPILLVSSGVIIALQVVKVFYRNDNHEKSGLWCNVPIPLTYIKPFPEFDNEFQIEYLLPVAVFPQENYLERMVIKTGTTELEVFQNFVFYQMYIRRLVDRLCYIIIGALIFYPNLHLSRLTVNHILGPAMVTNNSLATLALSYLLAGGLTTQVCLIVIKSLEFGIYIVVFIIKFVRGKMESETTSLG